MINQLQQLRMTIANAFSEDELITVCFDRQINYSDLEGATRLTKIVSLLYQLHRQGDLAEFVSWARHERSSWDWPEADWNNLDWPVYGSNFDSNNKSQIFERSHISATRNENKVGGKKAAIIEYMYNSGNVIFGDGNTIINYPSVSPSRSEVAQRSPYRGLDPFETAHADFFFGRDDVIHKLMTLTRKQNFIPILGSSGSGKSSVVLAGLIPALERIGRWENAEFQPDPWQYTYFRPGANPFQNIAAALIPLFKSNLDELDQVSETLRLAEKLEADRSYLFVLISLILKKLPNHRILLVADQFEELFLLCFPKEKRHKFLEMLTYLNESMRGSKPRLVIILTLRTDFLGEALTYPNLAKMLETDDTQQDVKLGPIGQKELIDVIERPARLCGVDFESGLIGTILNDVKEQPNLLPLLEFALGLLWDLQNDSGTNQITFSQYQKINGVEGALAQYANEIYDDFSASEQESIRYIFTQLVNVNPGAENTRQIVTRDQFGESNWDLVRKLADARLVVTSRNETNQDVAQVVHEALFRYWGKLSNWVDEVREFRMWKELLRQNMIHWQKLDKINGALLQGTLLDEAERWKLGKDSYLSIEEENYIDKSIAQREQENEQKKRVGINALALDIKINEGENRDLKFCNLNGANLEKANLSRADLRGADLEGVNLRYGSVVGANLSGANLRAANLSSGLGLGSNSTTTYLRGVNLSGADLRDANLSCSDLSGVDLSGADLRGAVLRRTNFKDADLSGADLREADLSEAARVFMYGINYQGADLSNANLINAKLNGANLTGAILKGAHIDDSTEIDEKWRLVWEIINRYEKELNLRGINLKTELEGKDLRSVNLKNVDLRKANLSGADLRDANLSFSDLSGADLSGADLRGAKLNQTNFKDTNLNGVDLRAADLSEAVKVHHFYGPNYQGADLSNANLSNAKLNGAHLTGVIWQGTQFNENTEIDEKWRSEWETVNRA